MPIEQAVAAFFGSRRSAEEAVERLLDLGVDRDAITLAEDHGEVTAPPETPGEGGGLFGVLGGIVPEEPEGAAERERRASEGWIVTVEVGDDHYDRTITILGQAGSIIRDEHTDV